MKLGGMFEQEGMKLQTGMQAAEKNEETRQRDKPVKEVAAEGDKLSISQEAKEKAAEMTSQESGDKSQAKSGEGGVKLTMGNQSGAEGASSGDDLQDAQTEVSKKEKEIEELEANFIGSDEDRKRELSKLNRELEDLEDAEKQLQNQIEL
ncbi:hypothetical protein [Salidesulfovibrio onnuriiensis]|uniref:hypothetical protein n=1 Tax=Salidesulfovibrio onnuriiensis TaxID=2583823 RepID=UPI0011CC95BC|nr:hypothetical protein [Salidesulfovibrio onnuriiensis]